MTTYTFELVLKEPRVSDEVCNTLCASGCDDATIVTRNNETRLVFDRTAESLEEAIRTAAFDARQAGVTILRVELEAPQSVPRAG